MGYDTLVEALKHLPGQHDQSSHAGGKGSGKTTTATTKPATKRAALRTEPFEVTPNSTHRTHRASEIVSQFGDVVMNNTGKIKRTETDTKYDTLDQMSLFYGDTEVARYTYGRTSKSGYTWTTYNQMAAAERFMNSLRSAVSKAKKLANKSKKRK